MVSSNDDRSAGKTIGLGGGWRHDVVGRMMLKNGRKGARHVRQFDEGIIDPPRVCVVKADCRGTVRYCKRQNGGPGPGSVPVPGPAPARRTRPRTSTRKPWAVLEPRATTETILGHVSGYGAMMA